MVDFTDSSNPGANVADWFEASDRKSKASIIEQGTQVKHIEHKFLIK